MAFLLLFNQPGGDAPSVRLFDQVADRVSVPVLLHAMKHFETREDPVPIRVFFPKGKLAKAMSVPNALPPMDRQIADRAADLCRQGIIRQLWDREPLGNVYVSDAMKQYIVPFSQRSASSGKHILVRGSTVPVPPEAGTIRGFIYWTNMKKTEKGVDP